MDIKVKDKVVGRIEKGTFIKKVKSSTYFLTSPPAIAFRSMVIDSLRKQNVTQITIEDTDTRQLYFTTLRVLDRLGFSFTGKSGDKTALALEYWVVLQK